ncbi:MAG: hypothetical protein HY076_01905 [Candidatus Eisenbacteria bacterium]|uniref:Uncharacterized protein n=1 Tax=Eiseniibacteriota bacterium TaxID=2212470 RepID=A0A9D6L8U5_UNCEI|nr:hypothetical protein [Candidatus Eisenbacteria bacterium]MBI3539012.1 hypothetical protein [Candidatus Eisenbacteria bacterium]
MRSRLGRWAPRLAAFLLVPALGLQLRLAPPAGNAFTLDAAGHERLIATRVAAGRLPQPDRLADPPLGRDLGRFLPLGLYQAAALWARAARAIAGFDLDRALRGFTALAGALIAIPVWFGARALRAGPWSAALAALIAVVLPAHVDLTTGPMLRYDAPGTLLATTYLMLGVAAVAAASPARARGLAALSALALLLALAVWRVPLILPPIVALIAAILACVRPPAPAWRAWLLATAVALVVACLGLEYLRRQLHVLAPSTLAVIAVAAALHAPALRSERSRPAVRGAIVLGAIIVAAAIGAALARGGDYETLGRLLRLRAWLAFGVVRAAEPMTGVLLTVRELQPLPPAALAGPAAFSWLAWWLVAAPAALWIAARERRRAWLGAAEPAVLCTVGVTLALALLTLLANRNRILLAPPVAVLIGAAAAAFARRPGTIGRIAIVALVPCVALAATDSYRTASALTTERQPEWAATLDYLRAHADGSPVLAPWERGYEIERDATSPAFCDGLLESPVNQAHILDAARALLALTPDSLAALCERNGVRRVVVPPSWSLYGIAMAARDPIAETIAMHRPLRGADANRVVVRMMAGGGPEPPFVPVFERGGFRVYARADAPPVR